MMKNLYLDLNIDLEREIKKPKLKDGYEYHQLKNRIESLPKDTVLDIVSRLPVKSIIQFTFVCKTFQTLSQDPELIRIHQSRVARNNPCLIFHCDYPLNNQLYCVDFPDQDENKEKVGKFRTPFSHMMQEFSVVGSCEGILCLVNSLFNEIVYIYNPFTRQYKELPRSIEFQDQEVIYGFGFHPIAKEYKVIKIIYYVNMYNASFGARRNIRSEVQIMRLSENKWRNIGKIPYELDRRSTIALVNGRLHWVKKYGFYYSRADELIVSFDLSDEQFREVPTPDCVDRAAARGFHLAVLSGYLSGIVPVRNRLGCLDIWVMKEYGVKESWEKQFRIEAHSPRLMNPDLQQSFEIWKSVLSMRYVRVLCLLENGEILIEYKGGTLACYNTENGIFKDLTFPGVTRLFQTYIHFGSLNWIE